MKLEDAIRQTKPFTNAREKALVNLTYTQGWLSYQMKSHFKAFGITSKQYNILRILKGADKPVSNAFIRERLVDRVSDVSRILERMYAQGLVIKKSCLSDKRLVDVELTKTGIELLDTIGNNKETIDVVLNNLTDKEVSTLNNILDKIRH